MWLVAAGFLHVTARNFIANSTLSHHVSVLGYSALPLIPVKLFLFLCPVPFHVDYLTMLLVISLTSWSSYLAYFDCNFFKGCVNYVDDSRRLLLWAPIFLAILYMNSLST